ncbi:MAG: hypothetical protein ACFFEK_10870 [Candidatus Thorarchaeota archaeon]
MQGTYLTATIGTEFFLLAGYLFYMLFRRYSSDEDKITLMRWVIGIWGFFTSYLIISVALVATRMPTTDLVISSAILIVDVVVLYLLFDDTKRVANSLLVEQA